MMKLWPICRNTFLQTIRQPIYGILILVTFGVLLTGLLLAGWTMSEEGEHQETDQKMMENLGLSTLLVSGLFVASFSASAVISREIDDKTAQTVISKPVSRMTFVLGKFVGVGAAATVAFYLAGLVFLMMVRYRVHTNASDPFNWPVIVLGLTALFLTFGVGIFGNVTFGWTFTATTIWSGAVLLTAAMGTVAFLGDNWEVVAFGQGVRAQLLVGMLLYFMAVLLFVAVAVAASTRLGQAMTLLVCFSLYCIGAMHPHLFGQDADPLARGLGMLLPNLTSFDPLHALSSGRIIPARLIGMLAAYWACYVAGVLAIAVALFQTRQLEGRTSSVGMPGLVGMLAWAGRAGAVVGAVVSLRTLASSEYHTATGLASGAGGLLAAAVGWYFWGRFGQGRRWTYWVVTPLVAVTVSAFGAVMFLDGARRIGRQWGLTSSAALIGLIAVSVVLLVLLLPKTRRHFRFVAD